MTESQRLLDQYAQTGSDAAFRELITRYVDLVYSTALRRVEGDTHRAEDVTQTVFVDLARMARTLSSDVMLGGWLHRHTCFVSANTMRGERRRQSRERQAVEMNALQEHADANLSLIAPILDQAINELGEADRTAILLRFFEQRDFRTVGQALGSNEDAARMRVTRALGKLESLLKRHGITTTSAATLSVMLSANAVQAAPVGLAVTISTAAALAGTTIATTATATAIKTLAMTTLKKTVITAIVIASVVTPLVLQHKTQARLHDQDEALRQRADRLAKLRAENEPLSKPLAQATSPRSLSDDQFSELLKLRGEVGRLRTRAQELTKIAAIGEEEALLSRDQLWPARVNRLKQWLEENPSEKIPELQSLSDRQWMDALYASTPETADEYRVAMSNVRSVAQGIFANFMLRSALQQYAKDNSGQFPSDLSQLRPYFDSPIYDGILERYTILPASSLVSELRPGGDWVITQKAPVNKAHDWRTATSLTGTKQVTPYATNRWVLIQ